MVLHGTSGTFWKFYKNYLLFLVLFVIFLFVGTVPGWVDSNPKWGRACRPLSLQLQGHHCLQGQTISEQLLPTTGRSLVSTDMYFIQGGHHCHHLCQYQMVNLCTGPFGGGEHVHRDVKVRQNCLVAHQVSIFTRLLTRYQFSLGRSPGINFWSYDDRKGILEIDLISDEHSWNPRIKSALISSPILR